MNLGLRATARELGISHVALLNAETDGRVPKRVNGFFDVEVCRKALAANSHPKRSASGRAQQRRPEPAAEPTPAPIDIHPLIEAEDDSASPDPGSIAEATRQLEWEKLREKRLKVDREEAKLVPLIEVNAHVAGMIIKARDEFLRIAPETRDDLARQSDPIECERIVQARITEALEKLSEFKPAA